MLLTGTRLGPYRITAPLGAGGMGEVYRAHDARLDREVAIKVIPHALAADADRIRRFEQEARAAGALNHPNVISIFDVGDHDGSPFVVMELLEGETLRERIAGGPLSLRKAVDYAAQAANGLAAAHEKGIIHRDLKPENLFVTRDGRVKVLDFGLAKLTRPETPGAAGDRPDSVAATETGAILGTAGYMAPEQARGRPADQRSDLFALGAILYEMLAGARAFRGASFVETLHAILNEEPPPLTAPDRDIPPRLEHVVRHCLEKSPEERFQTARDLAFDLQGVMAEMGAGQTTIGAARPVVRRRVSRGVVIGVLAGMIGSLIAASLFLRLRDRTPGSAGGLEPKRIVVAVFENQTGDPALDPLGRMTSDWITQGLSRVEGLQVVPSTSVLYAQPTGSRTKTGRDPIRALAEETGSGTVVSGAYYLQGDTLQLQAKVTDVVRGRLLEGLEPVRGPRNAPMVAIDAVRQRVLGGVAANLEGVHEMGTQQQPPLYDAYREFIAGFEIFQTDGPAALRGFERAVELDPGFLTPLFYEAYLLNEAGDHARVEAILHKLADRREQLPPFGRQWLDAMSAYSAHRYSVALQHLRVAEQSAPRDPMTALWIGWMARASNRPQELVNVYDRFGAPPFPGHSLGTTWTNHRCDALHVLERYPRELEEARRERTRNPESSRPRVWEMRALAALGRVTEAERLLDESMTWPGDEV
jgi:TolB-like protein